MSNLPDTPNDGNGERRRKADILRDQSQKPPRCQVNPDGIPDALKALPRWVCWSWRWKDGKWSKPPINAKNGGSASSTNPATWATFQTAFAYYLRQASVAGIGLVLGMDLRIAGADLDDCRDERTGQLDAWAQSEVDLFSTYTEISPTGTGVKMLAYGTLGKGSKQSKEEDPRDFEIYDSGRYFTVTGQIVGAHRTIEERQDQIDRLQQSINNKTKPRTVKPCVPPPSGDNNNDRAVAISAVRGLNASRAAGYNDWLNVGMILHSVSNDSEMLGVWEEFSARCPEKYNADPGACASKWRSFNGGALGIGTLIMWAKEDGWQYPRGFRPSANGSYQQPPPVDDEGCTEEEHGDSCEHPANRLNENGAIINGHDKPRPRIDAGNGDLEEVTEQAWKALQDANEPPTLFRVGSAPARIETGDDENPLVRAMNVDRMRHRLARDATWFVTITKKRGSSEVAAAPPLAVVRDVLACPDVPLPILTRIVEAPVFAGDGSLHTCPGYSRTAQTYFAPAPGFVIPSVPTSPSAAEVKEAANLLAAELIGEFPFVGESEKAHAIAALLCPFARELIAGPTPLHSFEAPSPGSGKTLLVNAITLPWLGKPGTAMSEARDEDEWRKRVLAKLSTAPSVILIDNVRRRVDSAALACVLTAFPLWEDRILGKSEIIRVPVRCLWLMTGNNPAFSSEMTRRTIRIRLDAKQDQPWLRTGFRHPNLIDWAKANRGRLVWAALTLIKAWLCAGKPPGKHTLGMYENWARVMGGILDTAGVPGFLGNLQDFYESADPDGATWRTFVAAWWAQRGEEEVKAAELYTLAIEAGMPLGEKSEQSQKVRLGQKIMDARDRVFSIEITDCEKANIRIEQAGKRQRATVWRLKSESGESR